MLGNEWIVAGRGVASEEGEKRGGEESKIETEIMKNKEKEVAAVGSGHD